MFDVDALIVGGDSQIGKALFARLLRNGKETVATTRKWPNPAGILPNMLPFDLRWHTWLPAAEVTYFCTGINGFKPCEADPVEAHRINVTLLCDTAGRIAAYGGRVVFLSSSAAETHPDTVYGKCKLAAEEFFVALGGTCYRFGPVAFPGRHVYPNEIYSPMNLSTLTGILAGCFVKWEPGIHSLYNRDWVPEAA